MVDIAHEESEAEWMSMTERDEPMSMRGDTNRSSIAFGRIGQQCAIGRVPNALRFFILFGILALATAVRADSPFYLTVSRSMSEKEPVQIRLDSSDNQSPFLLRILKASDVDAYLDGQVMLSRAYEPPTTIPSLLRVFVDGANKAVSPLTTLRSALDKDFRRALHDSVSPPLRRFSSEPFVGPPSIRYDPPKGFSIIRQTYLDLSTSGKKADDAWWWFGETPWAMPEQAGYRTRVIYIDPLPPGLYTVQGIQGDNEAQALLQVSALSVQVKQSSKDLLIRIMNREGHPVSGVTARIRGRSGSWESISGVSNQDGELTVTRSEPFDGRLVVQVHSGLYGDALVTTDFLASSHEVQDAFIFTDRPIIKPGEEVFFGGIIRNFRDGRLEVGTTGSSGSMTLKNGDSTIGPLPITVSPEGSFSGMVPLPSDAIPGLYRVTATLDEKRYQGEVRIQEYVKPSFYLTFVEKPATLMPGQNVRLVLSAQRYRGGPAHHVRYEVFVYRKRFETPQFVADAGGGLVTGSDYYNDVRSGSALTQPQRVYSTVDKRIQDDSTGAVSLNPWASSPLMDDLGKATIEFVIPEVPQEQVNEQGGQEWIYTIVVRAQDDEGGNATASESIYVTKSLAYAAAGFAKTFYDEGDLAVPLSIQTSNASGDSVGLAKGEVRCTLEGIEGNENPLQTIPFVTDDKGSALVSIPLHRGERGVLRAYPKVTQVEDRPNPSPIEPDPSQTIIVGKKNEKIVKEPVLNLIQSRSVLSPGEHDTLVALLPESALLGERQRMWVSVAGRKIYDRMSIPLSGSTLSIPIKAKPEYGTAFYVSVALPVAEGRFEERTVSYRIVPKDQLLRVEVAPEIDVVAPLQDAAIVLKVTDSEGTPVPQVETFTSVVDEAVYAVQPEFRPTLLSFFLPIDRLNVSSFLSDELQGYGYADRFFRANYRLHALKVQNQPKDRLMRDTAGFFPHRITDANGEVRIVVPMPSNVTKWRVSSLAIDQSGRLGEGRGYFSTKSDISVEARVPSFLRQGDSVTGSVVVGSQVASQEVSGEINIAVERGLGIGSPVVQRPFSLTASESAVEPLNLVSSSNVGMGGVRVEIKGAAPSLKIGGGREFDVTLRSSAEPFSEAIPLTSGFWKLERPESVSRLEIIGTPGLAAAVKEAQKFLLSYPYGCTEQLLASTVPNFLALAGENSPVAKQNLATGLRKLLAHQGQSGGFGMYAGDNPSVDLTALVYSTLIPFKDEASLTGTEVERLLDVILERGKQYFRGIKEENPAEVSVARARVFAKIGPSEVPGSNGTLGEDTLRRLFEEVARNDSAPSISAIATASELLRQWGNYPPDGVFPHGNREAFVSLVKKQLHVAISQINSDSSGKGIGNGDLPFWSEGSAQTASVLSELFAWDELKPEEERTLAEYLMKAYDPEDGWGSTLETSSVLLGLRDYLRVREIGSNEREKADGRVCPSSVSLGIGSETVPCLCQESTVHCLIDKEKLRSSREGHVLVKLPDLPKSYQLTARVDREGKPGETPPAAGALRVERTLLRVIGGGKTEAVTSSTKLHRGDTVLSIVRFSDLPVPRRRWRMRAASSLFVVKDTIPSIAISVNDEREVLADAGISGPAESEASNDYWGSIRETHRFPWHIERVFQLPRREFVGKTRTVYTGWKVLYSGKASLPAARVTDMYNGERYGLATGGVHEVVAE